MVNVSQVRMNRREMLTEAGLGFLSLLTFGCASKSNGLLQKDLPPVESAIKTIEDQLKNKTPEALMASGYSRKHALTLAIHQNLAFGSDPKRNEFLIGQALANDLHGDPFVTSAVELHPGQFVGYLAKYGADLDAPLLESRPGLTLRAMMPSLKARFDHRTLEKDPSWLIDALTPTTKLGDSWQSDNGVRTSLRHYIQKCAYAIRDAGDPYLAEGIDESGAHFFFALSRLVQVRDGKEEEKWQNQLEQYKIVLDKVYKPLLEQLLQSYGGSKESEGVAGITKVMDNYKKNPTQENAAILAGYFVGLSHTLETVNDRRGYFFNQSKFKEEDVKKACEAFAQAVTRWYSNEYAEVREKAKQFETEKSPAGNAGTMNIYYSIPVEILHGYRGLKGYQGR